MLDVKVCIGNTPDIKATIGNLQVLSIGTEAISKICVLDLREYLELAQRKNDTLYFVRG